MDYDEQNPMDFKSQHQWHNNSLLEGIVNYSPLVLFLWKAEEGWPVEYVSENVSQLGYSAVDFLSKKVLFENIIHPDDLQRVMLEVKTYSEKGVTDFTQEYRILTADGGVKWIDDRTVVKRNDNGETTHYQGIVLDITARKEAEEKLRFREERLRSLVSILQYKSDSVQDFLDFALHEAIKLTQSKIGYICFYNEERMELTINKWSKEVMKECAVFDPQTIFKLENTGLWGEAIRQRKAIIINDFQVPTPLKKGHPEGHVNLYRFMTIPVLRNERLVAVVGVANKESDYSENDTLQLTLLMDSVWNTLEQRNIEKALQRSEEKYRQAYNLLQGTIESPKDVVIFSLDMEYRYLAFNKNHQLTMEHIWGIKIEIGVCMLSYIKDPTDREKAKANFDRALAGETFTLIEEYGDSSLNRRWYENVYSPLKDSKRNVIGLTLFLSDITERKKAEQELQNNKELLQSIIDILPGTLNVVDTEYNVIAMNNIDFRLRLAKCDSVSDVLGKKCHEAFMQSSSPCPWCKVGEVLSTGKTIIYETSPDDIREIMTGKAFQMFVAPIKDDLDNIKGVVEYGIDITDLRNSKLNSEAANKAKSEFLANMSHELRTPLNSIIGFSDALLEVNRDGLSDKQTKYVKNISKSGKHLLTIINDILDISKVEAGKMQLFKENVSVESIMEEMLASMQFLAAKKEIIIKNSIDSDSGYIRVDKGKIKQVLYNLVGNAIKFTNHGGIVTLRAKVDGDKIHISVQDSGIGISKKDQEKLFKPFSQIDSSVARRYDGTGLGLALAKELVVLHGGQIWVESELGRGSTFTFTIPVHKYHLT
ncbi:ATP-binding protein [uncultured Methanomethylovorans sp.]|uniref:ATP-binding protein n=1 Tax=uncultured Methanomethylovorans sp. TaxID=183759 RepID=UPI002AA7A901|nr:ATP-binding protein [uncultured Methanomethylovorans sp.]